VSEDPRTWPSGRTERVENLKVDQVLTVEEARVAARVVFSAGL
jgi:hypothetical protein